MPSLANNFRALLNAEDDFVEAHNTYTTSVITFSKVKVL